jgi:hypothetical protein
VTDTSAPGQSGQGRRGTESSAPATTPRRCPIPTPPAKPGTSYQLIEVLAIDTKLASIALTVACLLAGCGSTTSTAPPPSPAGSPAAQVDASAPGTSSSPVATPTISASPATTAPSPSDSPRDVADVPADFAPLDPGAYYVQPEDIPVRVVFTVPAEGWIAWIGTAKPEQPPGPENRYVGISIVNVTNLVVDGCTDHRAADPPVGPTVNDLVEALASLQPFVVTKPPRDVTIYGYDGQHLELAVPEMRNEAGGAAGAGLFPDCTEGRLKSWIGRPLSYAYWGYTEPGQHEEFWILDVQGSRLVIEASWSPDSPREDLAELRTVLDSIVIQ